MLEVSNFTSSIIEGYETVMASLPPFTRNFINLFLLVVLVVIYAIFIWKFYRFIAQKNILGLDLNKYNKTSRPLLTKIFAGGLYFLEYVLILPIIIFIGFGVFTLFLIFLNEGLETQTILIISATIVAAIRMTAYYKEDLSKELAKILPFMLLAVSLLNPEFFNFERILGNISQIPGLLNNIFYYLVFIIVIEVILRLFDFAFSLFGLQEETEEEEKTKEESKSGS